MCRGVSHPTAVFALASGRSGTHFLYELIRRNALDCIARHETYGYNPSMFGRPIYDHVAGKRDYTRRLLARKQRILERCGAATFVETSHAFLKSWFDLAPEYFPRLKFIRLVRDPLKVAKSEASREELIHRLHIPFCHYRGGNGQRYFRWSLTGLESIFAHFGPQQLSRLQWYLVQWIEIENRALQFLDRFQKHADCFTLHSPADLNDEQTVRRLFGFLDLRLRGSKLSFAGRQNRNWRATLITDGDRRQFAEVVSALPASYLEVFRREDYNRFPWIDGLRPTRN